ncbi:MAG: S41 family peptidase [Phycisphaerae bacterium]|nr:S41 family peptidase [Phycisphaerae bacterium]
MIPTPISLVLAAAIASTSVGATVDLPRYPTLSPDGRELVFSWRGDLWRASTDGGVAVRLTSNPADDLKAAWSADGARIAFESERDGYRNLFTMKPDGTNIVQISKLDVPQSLSGFGVGPDGAPTITFDASIEGDLFRSPRPYQIELAPSGLAAGMPRRVHDAFGTFAQYSRDGSKVLFERGGSAWLRRGYRGPDARDVWMFDVKSGAFTRLTDWAGNDGMPRWINDDSFVFLSDREKDTVNLYRQSTAPGAPASRLTDFAGEDVHGATVSADGKRAVVAAWDALYSVDLTVGSPNATKLSFTANDDGLDDAQRKNVAKDTTEAALSPDGLTVALIAYGDVWVKGTAEKSVPRRITDGVGRERDVAWSADGLTLYFVSDRDVGESIYAVTVDKTRDEVRKRTEERLHPKPTEPKADEHAAPHEEKDEKPADEKQPEKPADDKKDSEKPKDAEKDKEKANKKKDPTLDPARWADAITFTVVPFVHEATFDSRPSPSPDNKSLAFRRGNGDIMVMDLETKAIRSLAQGFDADVEFRWSPDSQLMAYAMDDRNFNSDIWIMPVDGSAPAANVTKHPDSDRSPRWSADGKVLVFISERTNEENDVWTVFLERDLEGLKGKDLEQYYKDAGEAAKKRKPPEPKDPKAAVTKPEAATPAVSADEKPAQPVATPAQDPAPEPTKPEPEPEPAPEPKPESKPAEPKLPFGELDLNDAYLRVRRVTNLPGNESNLELLPAGDKVIFTGAEGTTTVLYSMKTDGTGIQKIGATGSVQGLNFDGSRVVVVAAGAASSLAVGGGDIKGYELPETVDIDLGVFAKQKFIEAARVLGQQFYEPTMKGLDWPKLTEKYLQIAERSRTNDEFDWVANRFLGELNASHLGVRSPEVPSPLRQPQGRLGVRTTPVADGFEVRDIIEGGPGSVAKQPFKLGDVITAIDFVPFVFGADGATETIEARLAGKVGKEVVVTVRRAVDGAEPLTLDLLVVPASAAEMAGRVYEQSTLRNRKLVDEWSGGKLGYIHIRGMDQASLDDFERDLYASADGKKGLLIDVRNNGGGSTADLLLASIMVKPHAYTIPRGGDRNARDGYPQDRLFIQRYTMPIDMLCNEKSFSNAEITAHAFKTLERGTLVGQQTYGGVISTGGTTLLDGTTVRLPFRGWYLEDGSDMENNGAMPDLVVLQTPEDESTNLDAQLKAAVEDLMKRVR